MLDLILLGCFLGLWIIINLFENRFEREIERQNEIHKYLVEQINTTNGAVRKILEIIIKKKE